MQTMLTASRSRCTTGPRGTSTWTLNPWLCHTVPSLRHGSMEDVTVRVCGSIWLISMLSQLDLHGRRLSLALFHKLAAKPAGISSPVQGPWNNEPVCFPYQRRNQQGMAWNEVAQLEASLLQAV